MLQRSGKAGQSHFEGFVLYLRGPFYGVGRISVPISELTRHGSREDPAPGDLRDWKTDAWWALLSAVLLHAIMLFIGY